MTSINTHTEAIAILHFSDEINYPISNFVWGHLGTLARLNSYNLPPQPQTIKGNEALKFADSLAAALDDIPDFDSVAEYKRQPVRCPDGEIRPGLPLDENIDAFEWFSYDGGQQWLKDFIIRLYFCRGFDCRQPADLSGG